MDDCIFCQIGSGKIPSAVVYQDETVMAFKDIHPKAPVHLLIIPKKHIASIADIAKDDLPIAAHLLEVANIVAEKVRIPGDSKLVVNTGPSAGHLVMHLHKQVLGGKKITAVV